MIRWCPELCYILLSCLAQCVHTWHDVLVWSPAPFCAFGLNFQSTYVSGRGGKYSICPLPVTVLGAVPNTHLSQPANSTLLCTHFTGVRNGKSRAKPCLVRLEKEGPFCLIRLLGTWGFVPQFFRPPPEEAF